MKVVNKFHKIDVLINNADAIFMEKIITNEGLENICIESYELFCSPNLFIESFNSIKVVNVSSEAHRGIKLI